MSLDRVAKQTGKDISKLYDLPEIAPEALYLFGYFCEVKGEGPLTYMEVEAWARLSGRRLTPGEVDILFMLDATFYESKSETE